MARRPSSYTTLTLAQKHELCLKARAEPSWSHKRLAAWATTEFKTATPVGESTVRGILKNKRKYDDVPETHANRKRHCTTDLRASDKILMERIKAYKAWHRTGTINGSQVRRLAAETEGKYGSSKGWLYKFQLRNGLWFCLRHGEAGSLDENTVMKGREELKAIVAQYHPRDIYNMDETSFFYRREPRGTLTTDKAEKGTKQSKERVTVCVATNAHGTDRLPLHFIGKSKQPRPFRGHDVYAELGATYTNTGKAWMNTEKYCDWLSQLNASMQTQQRHILLLVDNVSSHNEVLVEGELSNVKVHKLPPNTTAALQPMDQGIIKCLKDEYRNQKEEAEMAMFLRGEDYKSVDLFSAMKWCSEGFRNISEETIRNCWCRTGFISKADVSYILN